jgi:hypothetical protein
MHHFELKNSKIFSGEGDTPSPHRNPSAPPVRRLDPRAFDARLGASFPPLLQVANRTLAVHLHLQLLRLSETKITKGNTDLAHLGF